MRKNRDRSCDKMAKEQKNQILWPRWQRNEGPAKVNMTCGNVHCPMTMKECPVILVDVSLINGSQVTEAKNCQF